MADVLVLAGISDESLEKRQTLQQVLQSDLFQRAPNLSRILTHLCEKYFEGNADRITEYSIAVEALGRSAAFDPQVDAIVRVDLHLLRKRLRAYYSEEGKCDPVQIVLRAGGYVPEFVSIHEKSSRAVTKGAQRRGSECESPVPAVAATEEGSEQQPGSENLAPIPKRAEPPRRTEWHLWLAVAGCGLLLVFTVLAALSLAAIHRTPGLVVLARVPKPAQAVTAAVLRNLDLGSQPDSLLKGIRIRCGSKSDYVDSAGLHWSGDRDFTGGTAFARPVNAILRSTDPALYSHGRQGVFRYDIPVAPGTYEVRLLFAETQPGIEDGMREESYTVGLGQADMIDVPSDAGGANAATERVYAGVRPGEDGKIQLNFWWMNSELNAIEILPETNGKPQPVRISTLPNLYEDASGGHWLPDRFYFGGRNSGHEFARNRPDPPLLSRERYGSFDYAIPVAKGYKYELTLYMSEHYWGVGNSGRGGVGSRIFSVRCNGLDLLTNFDLMASQKDASAVAVRFRDLEPDATGKLHLSFVPVVNYALVNAIEVRAE